jgi:four helix bundle protein
MEVTANFTELIVWRKAHEFTMMTYTCTRVFPSDERYGLTSQFRRAAVSVAANIAEGYARKGAKDKLRFLNYADASLQECKYYVILAKDLCYLEDASLGEMAEEIGRLLFSYSRSVRRNSTDKRDS